MKNICFKFYFIIFIFTILLPAQSIYYVAPSGGSDDSPGTIGEPWATWQKAFDTAEAGDTVYFRGGVWYPEITTHYIPTGGHGHNGNYDNWIVYTNYPGETPILDCKNFPAAASSRSGLNVIDVTYIKFKGLTIRNTLQTTEAQWIAGATFTDSGVLYLEKLTSTGHGGAGFRIAGWDTLYMVNCDSYNNIDSTSTGIIGGRADGYTMSSGGTALDTFKIAYIYGCRAWYNSDDGFDISSTKQLDVHDCWSWNNGRLYGDACGFKWAYSNVLTPQKRKVYNTITAYNYNYSESGDMIGGGHVFVNLTDTAYGIYQVMYNNTSYRDYMGHLSAYGAFDCENEAMAIYRNNLVYEPQDPSGPYQAGFKACNYGIPTYVIQDHNTWIQVGEYWQTAANDTFNVTDADFANLDTSQLGQPRKPDGSLPDITFLRLAEDSDLIDGGVDVSLPYIGNAPDIGAFEYNPYSNIHKKYSSPDEYHLFQNYPNPFNPITNIEYQISNIQHVELSIYNIRGQKVATLVNRKQKTGKHTVKFNAGKLASGVYFYTLKSSNGLIKTKKLLLLR